MGAKNLTLIRLLFLLIIISSCSKEREIDYYKVYGIKDKKNEQIKGDGYIFFAQNNNEQICLVKAFEIFHAYKEGKKVNTYEEFFNNVLNEKESIKIDSTDHKCFKVNDKIKNDYLKLEKNEFLKKYTIKSGYENRYLINNKLEWDEIENVGYFLFKSRFGIIFDDYLGAYYVNNLDK